MGLQNIGCGNNYKGDALYRYKMPKMVTKIEGRGNGIKTNLVNMNDIAKALSRPPSYIIQYLCYELGTRSTFDHKIEIPLINGAYDTAKLALLVDNFIKKFVQCYGCGSPETQVIVTKSGLSLINLKCAACGFISGVDMKERLTAFIVENHPNAKIASSGDKKMMTSRADKYLVAPHQEVVTKQKKKASISKSKKKSHNAPVHDCDDEDDDDDDDAVQWQTDTSSEAAQQTIQQQLNEATLASLAVLPAIGKRDGADKDEVFILIKECLSKGSSVSQVKSFLESLSAPRENVVKAYIEALFRGVGKGFCKEVVKKKNYIVGVIQDDEESQRHLLLAIQAFCGKASKEAVREVGLVLKALYDEDVLEEEFLVDWYEKGVAARNKSSAMWKYVQPLVEWLQNAESESEQD